MDVVTARPSVICKSHQSPPASEALSRALGRTCRQGHQGPALEANPVLFLFITQCPEQSKERQTTRGTHQAKEMFTVATIITRKM